MSLEVGRGLRVYEIIFGVGVGGSEKSTAHGIAESTVTRFLVTKLVEGAALAERGTLR